MPVTLWGVIGLRFIFLRTAAKTSIMESIQSLSNSFGSLKAHSLRRRYVIPISGLFLFVPALFLFVAMQLTKAGGPPWLGSNFENNYPYLFNSLLLVKKQTPYMIGHPGLTTQFFGASILRASVPGRTTKVVEAVLGNPEKFIKRIQRSMLILTAVSLWILPWLTALYIGSYFTGFLLQLPSLFFITLLRYAIWFGSDLMLVPFCVAALCLCVILTHQRWRGQQRRWTLILAGIVCALGTVTKLTFFPLIFIIVACCCGLRNRLIAGASFAVATALALMPIYPKLAELGGWIFGIATHTGFYGSGDVGFARADTYFATIGVILSYEPMVACIPALGTLAIIILSVVSIRVLQRSGNWLLAWSSLGLFTLQVLSFLLVAKHANFQYFIPIFLSVALNLVLLYEFSRTQVYPKLLRIFSSVTLLGLIGCALGAATLGALDNYGALRDWRDQQLGLYGRVVAKVPSDLRIDYYRSISPQWAEYFGNQFAGKYFAAYLDKKYPHALFYNIFSRTFEKNFLTSVPREEVLKQHDHLYFFGNRADQQGIPDFDGQDFLELDNGGLFFLDEWARK